MFETELSQFYHRRHHRISEFSVEWQLGPERGSQTSDFGSDLYFHRLA